MYYHEFVELNQDLFIELAKELANNKVFIEYSLDTNYKPSHIPYVRGGSFIEGSGFYLRSSNYMDFTPEQIQSIESIFPFKIKDYTFVLSSISEVEEDDDRIFQASISFLVLKDNKNVI